MKCSACQSTDLEVFFEISDVPVLVCVFWPDPVAAAGAPRGDIVLSFCNSCGYIENQAFDVERVVYQDGYENSLNFSEFFQDYIEGFAADLHRRHDLNDREIVEIGCGDGQFLEALCALGGNRGIGFDPSYPADLPLETAVGSVRYERAYYTDQTVGVDPDFVVCRQVLEHIADPAPFLAQLRRSVADDSTTFVFEVPNASTTLDRVALWEIIYEHVSYFTAGSLARLFARSGFDVEGTVQTYENQFLTIEGRRARQGEGTISVPIDDVESTRASVDRFAAEYRQQIGRWQERLAGWEKEGRGVVLWGAGARGANFLNIADPGRVISTTVDVNPRKHGLHVAGTGQPILAPDDLRELKPDVVVLLNDIYRAEIGRSLDRMGLSPEVHCAA